MNPGRICLYERKGFTLIEAIMVIVVLGIMGAITVPLLVQAVRSYMLESNILDADAQGQLAMERMAREIRLVNPANITTFNVSTFAFTLNGESVSYSRNAQNQLLRNTDLLAAGVTSLAFAYYGSDWTTITADREHIWRIKISLTISADQVGGIALSTSTFLRIGDRER